MTGAGGEFILLDFGGTFYNCGGKDHKANQFSNKEAKENKGKKIRRYEKFKGKCRNCDKPGHKVDDLWEREANWHKRPAW